MTLKFESVKMNLVPMKIQLLKILKFLLTDVEEGTAIHRIQMYRNTNIG